jgi:hypothetical protein
MTGNKEQYHGRLTKAYEELDKAHKLIGARFEMEFPDIDPFEFKGELDVWSALPTAFASNVRAMTIRAEEKIDVFLVRFTRNGFIKAHIHPQAWEAIVLLDGDCEDLLSNKRISFGDPYFIEPKEPHFINSINGCLLLVAWALTKEELEEFLSLKLSQDDSNN